MALTTIAIEGKGVIANCDAVTNDTGGTGTGDWSEQGGGTMALSTDVFLVGSSCIGGKYASKSGFQQFDLGAGNELDFTATTGSEAGQMIYMWISMSALGTLDTLSTYPLCIRVSSSSPGTSNYVDWLIAGNDDTNGWTGGFKCFIIDPTKTGSRVSGTQSSIIASVRTLGVWIDCSTSARADTIFIDQIAVGSGLRITGGSSTTGWKDVVDYCTDYANRGWGMWQEREGIYYTYGQTYIGDSTQTATLTFQDEGRIIQYGVSEYCTDAAGTWASSVPTDFSGIVVEDAASYTTTFEDGVIVGTDSGRSGTVFVGNDQMDVTIDLYGGNNASSLTKLYGTSFRNLTGGITWGNDADHLFYGGTVIGCGQFDPVGAPKLRNLLFVSTTDSYGGSNIDGAALLWNSNIDIEDCQFIANTDATGDPSAIQHDSVGTFDYTNLTFSGNDFDILHNANATVEDSYPTANRDSQVAMSGVWNEAQAQTFTTGGSAVTLSRARWDLKAVGSPTGNVYSKLYATSGGAPTGSALATSNAVSAAGISASWATIDFEFEDEYEMSASTVYAIAVEFTGGDGSNYLHVGVDASSPTHSGSPYYYLTGSWNAGGSDHIFYVHVGGIVKVNNDGGNVADADNFQATNAGALIVVATVTLSIKVIDTDLDEIQDAQVAIFRTSDGLQLMNEDTLATGFATESFNYPGSDVAIYIRVRKSSTGSTRYLPFSTTGLIESGGFSLTVTLQQDAIVAA